MKSKALTWQKKVKIAEQMLGAKDTKKTSEQLGKKHDLTPRQVQSIDAQRRIHIRQAIAQMTDIIESEEKKRDSKKKRGDGLLHEEDVHGAVEAYADAGATGELVAIGGAFNTTDFTVAAMAYEYAGMVEALLVLHDRLLTKENDPLTAQKVLDKAVRISKEALT